MKSRNIKILAIVFILIINIVFAILISNRISYNKYYNSEDLDTLYSLLSESNVIIPKDLMKYTKVKMNAYTYRPNVDTLEDLIKRNYSVSAFDKYSNEIDFEYNDGSMFLTTESTIDYLYNDYIEESLDYLLSVNDISSELINSYTNKIKSFLNYTKIQKDRLNRSASKCDIILDSVYKTRRGNYYLIFNQKIGENDIINTFSCVISNDTIVRIQGELFLLFPQTQLQTENASMIDILMNEKKYFDEQKLSEKINMENIEYCYEFCFDGYDKYYFIPICKITYSNGTVRLYDYVTGEIDTPHS